MQEVGSSSLVHSLPERRLSGLVTEVCQSPLSGEHQECQKQAGTRGIDRKRTTREKSRATPNVKRLQTSATYAT